MRAQHEEAQKEVAELMGSVEHATDGRSMELAGRLQRADEIIDEAELHVVLEHNHGDSEKQHSEGNRGNGKGGVREARVGHATRGHPRWRSFKLEEERGRERWGLAWFGSEREEVCVGIE
jgi:hypothetical protein